MYRPFLFFSIPLIIGILLSYYFSLNILVLLSILLILLLIYFTNIIRAKSNIIVIFILFLFLGSLAGAYQLDNSILKDKIDKKLIFEAVVHQISYKDENQAKYIIVVHKIIEGDKAIKLKERSNLKIIGKRDLQLGDKIIFEGVLKEPYENSNPKLYNYKLNLLSNKIHTTISIRESGILKVEKDNRPLKYVIRSRFEEKVNFIFNKYLNEDNSKLIIGMILGEYSYLEEEDIEKYRELGLAHILAVSGLHIGIIAGFIIFTLSHLGIKRNIAIIMTLVTIWFYAFLIGFPPSILRANIMYSLAGFAFLMKEPYDSINSLFFSLFILLIVNPFWVFNIAFQLSFTASFSMIYFMPKIRDAFYLYKGKILYALYGLLAVNIGLLPVQAYYFNRLSILSILSNLILAPIYGLILVLGAALVLLSYLLPFLNLLLGEILNIVISIQSFIVDFIYKLPIGVIKLHSPNICEITLYYLLILFIVGVIDLKKLDLLVSKHLIYFLVFIIIFNSIYIIRNNSMEIHFIDVGQGDAILIRTKWHNYLIDTGGSIFDSFDVGKNITLPYMKKLGINRMKAIFISHFDEDHCEALPLLLDNIKVENILISYEDNGNKIYEDLKSRQVPIIILNENDKINLTKDIYMEVLSPNISLRNRWTRGNNLSLVLLLNYYDKRILFTGDVERELELELKDKFKDTVDIIKVPHHGSNSSSSEEILDIIRPKIAIISVGRNNLYSHPSKDVLERYEKIGSSIYRTDLQGLIWLGLYKDKIFIKPYINERIGLIEFMYDNIYTVSFYLLFYLAIYILIRYYSYLKERLKIDGLQGTYK